MIVNLIQNITVNTFKSCGNILFNGFASEIKAEHKKQQKMTLAHFNPINQWSRQTINTINSDDKLAAYSNIIYDKGNKDPYLSETTTAVRIKCAALFLTSWICQPVALTLNLFNKVAKLVTFAHFWHPSTEPYSFKARLSEAGKDLLIVVCTPLIFIGMIFAALYGATASPYSGRKIFATLERLAYSGGYQRFSINGIEDLPTSFFMAPCFQPYPKVHLGGGIDLGGIHW